MRLARLWPFAAAAAGGACVFLGGPDFDYWWLGWVALLPILLAIRNATPRRAALLGFVAGFFCNAGGHYWIVGLLERFGHLPVAVGVLAWFLLAAYQALVFVLWAWAVARLRSWPAVWVAPLAMVTFELCVPFVFPWYMAITQAWLPPVIQVAEWTGPLGVTFLLAMVAGAGFDVIDRGRAGWRSAAAAAAVLALALTVGVVRMRQIDARRAAAPKIRVGVVQANVGILQKHRAALAPRHLRLHQKLTRDLERAGAELVVWPESAYPYSFWRPVRADWPVRDPRRVMRGIGVPILLGSSTREPEGDVYNSALLMQPDGRVTETYDKNFLLLFGEYTPFYEELGVERWVPAASNFTPGTTLTTMALGEHRLVPLICYEDILPAFGRRAARLDPNLLVNITNDAWFGRTTEPHQHLALSVFRSVETRLDLVRAVNTGVSAFVDAAGRVLVRGPSIDPAFDDAEPMTFLHEVAWLPAGLFYARVGDAFGWVCAVLLGIGLWRKRRR